MLLTRVLRNFAHNLKTFDSLQKLDSHLRVNQFPNVLVYFRANWNPQCKESDEQITKFANAYPSYQIIKVDTDVAPKIAHRYNARTEPQFVFCLYGDEVIRQIGVDYQKLEKKVEMVDELAKRCDFHNLPNKWVEYGTTYKAYQKKIVQESYKANFGW